MKKFFFHPVTLVAFAFALLISAWSVIIVTAINNRAESVPLQQATSSQEKQNP